MNVIKATQRDWVSYANFDIGIALSHFVIALKLKEIDYVIDEENVEIIDNTDFLLSVKLLEKRNV
ncbi:hypothetical protein RI065_01660 [Mycoplasmatota bacterium zrk1]